MKHRRIIGVNYGSVLKDGQIVYGIVRVEVTRFDARTRQRSLRTYRTRNPIAARLALHFD